MSSSDEEFELNYGLEDESLGNESTNYLNDEEEYDKQLDAEKLKNIEERPRFDKNPKLKKFDTEEDQENSSNNGDDEENLEENGDDNLEDLLNLINEEEDDNKEKSEDVNEDGQTIDEKPERKKFLIKKDKLSRQKINDDEKQTQEVVNQTTPSKSSITITKIDKIDNLETIFKEKNTGMRIIKSDFKSEVDMNVHLACDYGKFYRLTELSRRMNEIKEAKDIDWFSIFFIGSKTESKCSAKGNNYVVWQIFDLNNLEREQEISLFLFGSAYKSHWKSSEFDCFVLVKPDFLEGQKNQQTNQQTPNNNYYSPNGSSFVKIGQNKKGKPDWNKFASKKTNQNLKLSLSVKSESQLVRLGIAKDISNCQSLVKPNPNQVQEAARKCKNLVNLEKANFCTYHCVQMDKANKNKYSMDKPSVSRFGPGGLFPSNSTTSSEFKFVPPNSVFNKYSDIEAKSKAVKEIKAEVLRSLNSSITKESPLLANILIKTNKKSDSEILADLDGKQLDKEELIKIRLAEQATVKHSNGSTNDSGNKEIRKLFNSKLLLPNENNITSISSQKLVEMKKTNSLSAPNSPAILSLVTNSSRIKEKYEDNKKNFALSALGSHKEILKEIKQKKETENSNEKSMEKTTDLDLEVVGDKTDKLNASNFLKNRIYEIKKIAQVKKEEKQPIKPKDSGFDLELYIGNSATTKKLMDVNSKYISFSPSTATSEQQKRKLEQMSPSSAKKENSAVEDAKAKRLKMIEELQNIKSNHAKEARDPEKNPALKAYYNKLALEEKVDEKLCNMRNREVRVVTCKTCSYTAFTQSDFCKLKKHEIKRHMVLQRFFKCKSCSKRTYTLDKVVPVSSCSQCGNDKYEPCTMKEDNCQDIIINKCTRLDQESEMFLSNE